MAAKRKKAPAKKKSDSATLVRVRKLVAALPDATEQSSWGSPTFRIRNRIFAMFADAGNNHGDGRAGLWCMSTHESQDLLIRARPDRFFFPAYVGPSGWVGVYLDQRPDWGVVKDVMKDAYDMAYAKGPSKPSAKRKKKTALRRR